MAVERTVLPPLPGTPPAPGASVGTNQPQNTPTYDMTDTQASGGARPRGPKMAGRCRWHEGVAGA